jgi:hypothetical protein
MSADDRLTIQSCPVINVGLAQTSGRTITIPIMQHIGILPCEHDHVPWLGDLDKVRISFRLMQVRLRKANLARPFRVSHNTLCNIVVTFTAKRHLTGRYCTWKSSCCAFSGACRDTGHERKLLQTSQRQGHTLAICLQDGVSIVYQSPRFSW